MRVKLEDVCERASSNLKQSDIIDKNGDYPIYGASGYIGSVDFYHQYKPYVAVVKDGAGIGRTTLHPAYSSVIGTMQYLLPKDNVLPKYLYYVVKYMHLEKYFTGATIPHIYFKDYKHEKFNLDKIDRQREIIDSLGKIENVIEKRQQELDKLDELVKARFVEMFGDPIDNPMGWYVLKLKEISSLITNGNTPKGGSQNYVEQGVVFLRSQNVWRNRIDLSDVAYIDESTHKSMKKSSVHHNDILITKTGRINTENSSLGRAALYTGEDNSANINGHVYLVRLKESVNPLFIVTILTGEAYRKYIRKVCVGGIDKRQINLDQVEEFPIILPPIEFQNKFADFAKQIDKSKVAVQKALDEAQLLFDSLMQEYFG